MATRQDPALSEFRHALSKLVGEYRAKLSAEDIAQALSYCATDLFEDFSEPILPEAASEKISANRYALRWTFAHPRTLDEEMDNILKVQAIYVEMNPTPAPMADVDVFIVTPGGSDIKLQGRAVHVSPPNVAIQITPPDAETLETLRTRPDALRDLKRKLSHVFPHLPNNASMSELLERPEVMRTLQGVDPLELSVDHLIELASASSVVMVEAQQREIEAEVERRVGSQRVGMAPRATIGAGSAASGVAGKLSEQSSSAGSETSRWNGNIDEMFGELRVNAQVHPTNEDSEAETARWAGGNFEHLYQPEPEPAPGPTPTPELARQRVADPAPEMPPIAAHLPEPSVVHQTALGAIPSVTMAANPSQIMSEERDPRAMLYESSHIESSVSEEPLRIWRGGEHEMLDVLAELARESASGMLVVELGREQVEMTLRQGAIVGMTYTPPRADVSLETLLCQSGKLTSEEVDQVRAHARTYGISSADALLDLQIVEYGELRVAMKTRTVYILTTLWETPFGRACLFAPDPTPKRTTSAPVNLYRVLLKRVTQVFQAKPSVEVEDFATSRRNHTIRLVDPLPMDPKKLKLHSKVQRFLSTTLDTPRRVDEALIVSPLNRNETLVWLSALDALGLLITEEINFSQNQYTSRMERLDMVWSRAMSSESHFEALGVHWSAYSEEIESAYQEFLEEFDPEQYTHRSGDTDVMDRLRQLRERIRLAYETLSSLRKRMEYRYATVDRFKMRAAVDMYEKQIEGAKMRQDVEAAIDYCRRILELSPRHAEARQDLRVLIEYQNKKGKGTGNTLH